MATQKVKWKKCKLNVTEEYVIFFKGFTTIHVNDNSPTLHIDDLNDNSVDPISVDTLVN